LSWKSKLNKFRLTGVVFSEFISIIMWTYITQWCFYYRTFNVAHAQLCITSTCTYKCNLTPLPNYSCKNKEIWKKKNLTRTPKCSETGLLESFLTSSPKDPFKIHQKESKGECIPPSPQKNTCKNLDIWKLFLHKKKKVFMKHKCPETRRDKFQRWPSSSNSKVKD
jgi:hypothetical protein